MNPRRLQRVVTGLVAAAAAAFTIACSETGNPAAPEPDAPASFAKTNGTFNQKFTFTDVTFTDGTTGTIRAGSKTTGNGSTFTTCGFFGSDDAFLGEFQSAEFASSDPAQVQAFCKTNFKNRV